jgi:hypothetical protein
MEISNALLAGIGATAGMHILMLVLRRTPSWLGTSMWWYMPVVSVLATSLTLVALILLDESSWRSISDAMHLPGTEDGGSDDAAVAVLFCACVLFVCVLACVSRVVLLAVSFVAMFALTARLSTVHLLASVWVLPLVAAIAVAFFAALVAATLQALVVAVVYNVLLVVNATLLLYVLEKERTRVFDDADPGELVGILAVVGVGVLVRLIYVYTSLGERCVALVQTRCCCCCCCNTPQAVGYAPVEGDVGDGAQAAVVVVNVDPGEVG